MARQVAKPKRGGLRAVADRAHLSATFGPQAVEVFGDPLAMLDELDGDLAQMAAKLRDTARGLRWWCRNATSSLGPLPNNEEDGGLNPWHVAARLEKMADGLDGGEGKEQ